MSVVSSCTLYGIAMENDNEGCHDVYKNGYLIQISGIQVTIYNIWLLLFSSFKGMDNKDTSFFFCFREE